jgi:3-oxoadipate enol-lactonase
MVAQQLAVRHPHLVTSIVVANSSSYYDQAARATWNARIETVRSQGMEAIADGVMQRWFTPEFRENPEGAKRVAASRAVLVATDPKAYVDCCEAVSRIDFYGANPRIACPALVIAGTLDESAPFAMAEVIRNTISGAELVTLPAAHLSAVERPGEFSNLVVEFIRGVS